MDWSRVAIVASGPSLRGVDLSVIPTGIAVVAVNAAIRHLPRADLWFTCDPTGANVEILEHRADWPGTEFEVAWPESEPPLPYPGVRHLARLDKLWILSERTTTPPGNPRLCEVEGEINHGNSAWGALQRVVQRNRRRRGQKIILLGVDGTQDGYAWGDGAPRALWHLPALFRSALPQLEAAGIEVINGSPESRVDCFPRTEPRAALRWLLSDPTIATAANGMESHASPAA